MKSTSMKICVVVVLAGVVCMANSPVVALTLFDYDRTYNNAGSVDNSPENNTYRMAEMTGCYEEQTVEDGDIDIDIFAISISDALACNSSKWDIYSDSIQELEISSSHFLTAQIVPDENSMATINAADFDVDIVRPIEYGRRYTTLSLDIGQVTYKDLQ